jgi:type II secretory pathway pseudopilin PulG
MSNKMSEANGRSERGFSLLQLTIVVAVVGVVSTLVVMNMRKSRETLAVQNSVRQLAGYIEKARLDAVRRHDTTNVIFISNASYNVRMDFDGTGTPYTRTFFLEPGVQIPPGSPLPSIQFNWRGRTQACTNTFAFQEASGRIPSWVDVSDAGDVTVNGDVSVLPSISYATVSTTAGIASNTVKTGANSHDNTLDCDTTATGTAGPPVTGSGSGGCNLIVNPSSFSIRKNGGTTGSVVISSNTSGTVTASGPTNLKILPVSQNVSANGSVSFSVTSLNSARGTFAVNFSSACTTVTSLVKVIN